MKSVTKQTLPQKKRPKKDMRIPLLYVLYCTRVYFLMFGQVIMAYEGFPTFVTLVALVIMVDSEVEPVQGTVIIIISNSINDIANQTESLKHSLSPTPHSDLSGPTCRSCHDGNFGHRYYRGEASPRCGSSCAPSRSSYEKNNMPLNKAAQG